MAATLAVTVAVVAAAAALTLSGRAENPGPPPTAKPSTSVSSTSVTAATRALVAAAQLPGLLLNQDALSLTLATNHLQVASTSTALLDSSAEVTDSQCVSAWAPAQVAAYANSGDVGVQVQSLTDGLEPARWTTVTQAVIAFPTPNAADNAVEAQFGQWQQCANRTITVTTPGSDPMAVRLDAPIGTAGAIHQMNQHPEAAAGQHCQRTLESTNNVVVDIAACSPSVQDPARELIRQLGGQIGPG